MVMETVLEKVGVQSSRLEERGRLRAAYRANENLSML